MKFRRKSKEIDALYQRAAWKRKPFTPTLTESLVARLDAVCEAKFIHRDIFLEHALHFLVLRLYPAVLRIENPYSDLDRDIDSAFGYGDQDFWFESGAHFRDVNSALLAGDYYQRFIWNAQAVQAFRDNRTDEWKEYQ